MPARPEERPLARDTAPDEPTICAPQGGKSDDDPQSEIAALCRQAESLAMLMEAGANNDDPDNTNIRDTAFERICAIGGELGHYHAAEPDDILAKIRLWRLLVVEDALDPERSAPDELLLSSIINDIEQHLRAQ